MKRKHLWQGGILGLIGFLLSPLSWWNDPFVNIPLAVAFAWIVAHFYKPAFQPAVVIGYWMTNVLGFVLIQKGAERMSGREAQPYSKKSLVRDLVISLLYTALIVVLIKLKVLQPFGDYLNK